MWELKWSLESSQLNSCAPVPGSAGGAGDEPHHSMVCWADPPSSSSPSPPLAQQPRPLCPCCSFTSVSTSQGQPLLWRTQGRPLKPRECLCTLQILLHSLLWLHLSQHMGLSSPKSVTREHIQTLCLSPAKHLTVPITGKTFKQILKNQRFTVLHTIISCPGLGYFEKSRQNRLSSSHRKIKRH